MSVEFVDTNILVYAHDRAPAAGTKRRLNSWSAAWVIHRPDHADLIRAAGLQRRYHISWWNALIVDSAIELRCSVLWTEDLSSGQRYGAVTARNPFR